MANLTMTSAAPSTPPSPAPPTLLLVNDEPSILSALRRLVRPQGYRTLAAEGGASALELVAGDTVDLVISDMRMPGMDGSQFLEEIRHLQPHAVRILLTGFADISSTIAAINGGEIHRCIAKPWDDNDILLAVREALARRDLDVRNRELAALKQLLNEARGDRCISATDLTAGMVLSRHVVSPQGTPLLAAGHTFDARVVRQMREYAQREGAKLKLHVLRETAAVPQS